MPKLRLITFTLLALSAATAVHAEEKRYVSDELNTGFAAARAIIIVWSAPSTPGKKCRYCKRTTAPVTRKFATATAVPPGSRWKELSNEPSLRTRVPDLENQVKTLTDKLNNIDATGTSARRICRRKSPAATA